MDRETIQKILQAGAQAPSGSNSQPWEFEVKGNRISVAGFPEKDHPILNFRNRGTWVAHGALLENMIVAGRALGVSADISLFPDKGNPRLVAAVELAAAPRIAEPAYEAIGKRATNRKPYARDPLPPAARDELVANGAPIGGAEMRYTEARGDIESLGNASSMNEVVMFENKKLHNLFFSEIVWSEAEEREKQHGLYLKTMELLPPQEKAVKMLRYWPVMRLANAVGAAKKIARENAAVYSSTPFVGAVVCRDDDRAFVDAGRLMERMWLTATKLGLSFHLMTGVPFLHQRIAAGNTEGFSKRHVALVESAYRKIADVFRVADGVVALLFRIGNGGEPSARSSKAPPKIMWQN